MKIEQRAVNSLTPDPQNARKHDQRNLDAIKASLEKFGQRKPIVITPAGVVLAGNGTLEAAKALGWSEIAVALTPKEWDYATAKAYALADNRSAELAEWDTSILASQLVELDSEGWDIGELGFDVPEPTEPIVEDDTPLTFDDVEPITKLGDVWQLGRHRLMCGDSTSITDMENMNGRPRNRRARRCGAITATARMAASHASGNSRKNIGIRQNSAKRNTTEKATSAS